MKKIIALSWIPVNTNLALLVLRIWLGIGMFVNHGWEKIAGFSEMQQRFPDPLHIGSTTGLVFALLADGVCSLLIVFGLFTRLAAVMLIVSLGVAFLVFWQADITDIKGELPFVYLGGYIAIFLAGPGKYSADNTLRPIILNRMAY